MVDSFKELSLIEEKESRTLQEIAAREALTATNSSTIDVLSASIVKAQELTGQVERFNAMRNDNDFITAVDNMHAEAAKTSFDSFFNALSQGFETDITGRAELQNNAEGALEITVDITDQDLEALKGYPVLGHTILEIAMHLANNLRFAIISIANGPLRGEFDIAQLPQNIDNEREKFARQVSQSVNTSYLSGTQAAQELIRGGIASANRSN